MDGVIVAPSSSARAERPVNRLIVNLHVWSNLLGARLANTPTEYMLDGS